MRMVLAAIAVLGLSTFAFAQEKNQSTAAQIDYRGFQNLTQEVEAYRAGRLVSLAEFQQEINNNPQHVQSYLEIAAVQYHVDSATGAQYAEQAVRLQPTLPFAHYLLGLLYADSGNYEKAITQLELAERSHVREADLYYALSRAYSRIGLTAGAARARATFLQLSSQSSGPQEPNIYGEHRPLPGPDANHPLSAGEAQPQR